MVRELILDLSASKGLMAVSYFFGGIGSIWIEEGLYTYLGAELRNV